MPKFADGFDASQYAPVAERIALFYERFPEGRIVTRLVSRNEGVVTFLARVYRLPTDVKPAATGWASETIGDGDINSVACVENTETSAIGRALANLGFLASRNRPSLEEMTKAARARGRLARHAEAIGDGGMRRAGVMETQASEPRVAERAPKWNRQGLANATLDALRLIGTAERAGLDAIRVRSLKGKLRGGVSLASIERVESVLRKWLLDRPTVTGG